MKKYKLLGIYAVTAILTVNSVFALAADEALLWDDTDIILEEPDMEEHIIVEEFSESFEVVYIEEDKELDYWEFIPRNDDDIYLQNVETGEWLYNNYLESDLGYSEDQIREILPEYIVLMYKDGFAERVSIYDWNLEVKDTSIQCTAAFSDQNESKIDFEAKLIIYFDAQDNEIAPESIDETEAELFSDNDEVAMTEEVPEQTDKTIMEELPEGTTEAATEELTEETTEELTEEMPEETTEAVTEELTEETTEAATDKVPEESEHETEGFVDDEVSDMPECVVEFSDETYVYTGKPIQPDLKVFLNEEELVPGTDYIVIYENNTNVGTAKVFIEFSDDNCEVQEAYFAIEPQELDMRTSYIMDTNYVYNGNEILPSIGVKGNDGQGELFDLEEGVDYIVTYFNHQTGSDDVVNVGDIEVTIQGTGNFTGTLNGIYHIVACSLSEFQIVVKN